MPKPMDFSHGQFPRNGFVKAVQGGRIPMVFKIVGTVFLLFWMSMPTRALIEMLSKEKLAHLREAPFPAVFMILVTAIFPIAGLAGLFSLWRGRLPVGKPDEEASSPVETKPASPTLMTEAEVPRRPLALANCILPLFGLVFLLVGGFLARAQLLRIMDQTEPAGKTEYAMLLFPLPFILFGLVALFVGVKSLLPPRQAQSFDTPLTGLKLKRTGGNFGQKLFFTCFWCVLAFTFTTIWFSTSVGFSWTRDYWTFDKFFVLIFPLVGIGLIISCVREAVRRARTGRYEVEIACDRLRPGARVQVNYRFIGDAAQLDSVVFSLEQRNAVIQRAENPMKSTIVVHEIADPMRAQAGTFTMTIPPAIDSSRIDWRLLVKYADLVDTFLLDIG